MLLGCLLDSHLTLVMELNEYYNHNIVGCIHIHTTIAQCLSSVSFGNSVSITNNKS